MVEVGFYFQFETLFNIDQFVLCVTKIIPHIGCNIRIDKDFPDMGTQFGCIIQAA